MGISTSHAELAVVARDIWKQYPMGDVTVDALRGVNTWAERLRQDDPS